MNTVTRLKINVNNETLPVLYNGRLVNNYVGRYLNKVSELGFTPSSEQEVAIAGLVDNAISHDWLQYVDYLFPFLGTLDTFEAGAVPLIDRYKEYNICFDTRNRALPQNQSEAFSYDANNNIVSLGCVIDTERIIPAGIYIDHTYKGKLYFFYAIDASADYADIISSLLYNGQQNIVTEIPDGYESGDTTNRLTIGNSSSKNNIRQLYRKTNKTTQESTSLNPFKSMEEFDTNYLSEIYCRDVKISQCVLDGKNTILRNTYKSTSSNPILDLYYNYAFGAPYNSDGVYKYVGVPAIPLFTAAILNDHIPSAIAKLMSEDIFAFNVAIGKVEPDSDSESE